eukprot:1150703-Pelagomonas_calceolata.AAC.1
MESGSDCERGSGDDEGELREWSKDRQESKRSMPQGSDEQTSEERMKQMLVIPSPVAFIDMAAASRKTFNLTTPSRRHVLWFHISWNKILVLPDASWRSGRFILIKLLRSKYRFSDNIDTVGQGLFSPSYNNLAL